MELLQVIAPPQSFDAALGIYDALLARVEGVAFAADFHAHGRLGRAGMKNIAAGASHHCMVKLGVNFGFHNLLCCHLTLKVSLSCGHWSVPEAARLSPGYRPSPLDPFLGYTLTFRFPFAAHS